MWTVLKQLQTRRAPYVCNHEDPPLPMLFHKYGNQEMIYFLSSVL